MVFFPLRARISHNDEGVATKLVASTGLLIVAAVVPAHRMGKVLSDSSNFETQIFGVGAVYG